VSDKEKATRVKLLFMFQGLGTDEYSLIGLLSARTNDELEEIKAAYKESEYEEY